MSTRTMTQIQLHPHKARARALSLALVAASKPAPLLDIPVELGLEIVELCLSELCPFSTLAAVSKAFCALLSSILYRHVVLDSIETLSLFCRTTKSKSPDFLDTHIQTLAITIEPWRLTAATRIELEGIVAACTGIRAISVTRPRILLSHHTLRRVFPSEVTIQSFDSATPLEWARGVEISSAATHLTTSITHLRISEPGDTWHSPLSILDFFGSAPHLTHLALSRRMDANTDNDQVFVDEVCTLLASRRNLKMIVVRIFPAQWPYYFDDSYLDGAAMAESSSIWASLASVAEGDNRLILVPAGFKGRQDSASWAHLPIARVRNWGGLDFWEQSRKNWEAREQNLEE